MENLELEDVVVEDFTYDNNDEVEVVDYNDNIKLTDEELSELSEYDDSEDDEFTEVGKGEDE